MPEAAIIPIRVLPFMQILVTGLHETGHDNFVWIHC